MPSEPIDERDRFQLWVAGRSYDVHAVVIHSDTLIAIPYFQPPSCSSCALRWPLSRIDSVRVRSYSQDRTQQAGRGLLLAPLLLLAIVFLAVAVTGISGGGPI